MDAARPHPSPLPEGEGDSTGADTTLIARPAEIAPRAASSLLLDVARAGADWVAVGQRGDILWSADGSTWRQVVAPVDVALTRVRFLDPQQGWALGYDGTVLASNDGGKTWALNQYDATGAQPYFDILFFDAQHGLLAGADGVLKRSADGGKTWDAISADALQDRPNLYQLLPLGDGSLLLVGERGFLARSLDQGETWTQLKSPYTGSFFGALRVGARGALVFGLRGNAFYSADLAAAAKLTAAERQALRAAAAKAETAAQATNPVSMVHGWTHLESGVAESLFGGSIAADGRVLLFGMNGHVMQANVATRRLDRLPLAVDMNMNAGIADGDSLIVVGTAGVQRLPLPH